jgi:hypothetical protein
MAEEGEMGEAEEKVEKGETVARARGSETNCEGPGCVGP